MCGIFGTVALRGMAPSLNDAAVERLRDMLAHRGPDGAGLWRRGNAVLAHRRLAVIDPDSPAAAQPMATADGRFVMVYNGELYNDAEVRREIEARGVTDGGFRGFRSRCDTETVLHAFATWGTGAFARLRGMYALAVYDTARSLLTLARDPLGVKPLYFAADAREVVFASEPGPIVRRPGFSARPNLRMVSAYLTTIRTVLGNETLFEGVHALGPGQMAQCDLTGSAPIVRVVDFRAGARAGDDGGAIDRIRETIEDSIAAHLRSDVPTCALLSGGLDSTIVAAVAAERMERAAGGPLLTYCAGAAGDDAGGVDSEDFAFARLAAGRIGSRHAEAVVSRAHFREMWPRMVEMMGAPLSTPNEVAIHAVASRLREDGCVVTLSGEGADELFGGYEPPLAAAWALERGRRSGGEKRSGGVFQMDSAAWTPRDAKRAVLSESAMRALEGDAWACGFYEREFERCEREAGEGADPLEAHLRMHRRINLTGLLQRLDTATMLASVEGRTPFADAVVAEAAEGLPMREKFRPVEEEGSGGAGEGSGGGAVVAARARTKVALRRAFADLVPVEIAERPKASFPLPFQQWVADHGATLRRSRFARQVFSAAAIEMVGADPARNWRLAWPMMNIAMWGDAWW